MDAESFSLSKNSYHSGKFCLYLSSNIYNWLFLKPNEWNDVLECTYLIAFSRYAGTEKQTTLTCSIASDFLELKYSPIAKSDAAMANVTPSSTDVLTVWPTIGYLIDVSSQKKPLRTWNQIIKWVILIFLYLRWQNLLSSGNILVSNGTLFSFDRITFLWRISFSVLSNTVPSNIFSVPLNFRLRLGQVWLGSLSEKTYKIRLG